MSTNSCQLWSRSGACGMWGRQSSSFVQGKWQLCCQHHLSGLLETRWWLPSCRREHVFSMTTFRKRSTATKTSHYIVYPDYEEFMLQVCMTAAACSSTFAMYAAANLLTNPPPQKKNTKKTHINNAKKKKKNLLLPNSPMMYRKNGFVLCIVWVFPSPYDNMLRWKRVSLTSASKGFTNHAQF